MRFARAAAPYLLILPGGGWLFLFFLLPILALAVTSLESGDFIAGFNFDWNVGNYTFGLQLYSSQFLHSIEYGGPFFVSFVIRTLSWETLLADYGPLFKPLKDAGLLPGDFRVLATPVAVTGGLAYTFFPFMMLPIFASLEKIDRRLVEAAEDLFANRFEVFRRVIFPLSLPGVFAGVLLTGIPSVADYVNQDLLGGVGTTMIGRVIEEQFEVDINYPLAASLAFIFMVGLLAMLLAYQRIFGTKEILSD
ncbi:MAG: hypothetical protein AUI15_17320 [Actinobacteria bacterium 13_2_20CM_2_66_6]|nr:MAG: hypothetical protein AUI15_17320 [Actinobacteria bacterium 13_2_20CM_2_66_6]